MQDACISGTPSPSAPRETQRSVVQVYEMVMPVINKGINLPAASSQAVRATAPFCEPYGDGPRTPTLHLQDSFLLPSRPAAPLKEGLNRSVHAQVRYVRMSNAKYLDRDRTDGWQAGVLRAIQHATSGNTTHTTYGPSAGYPHYPSGHTGTR